MISSIPYHLCDPESMSQLGQQLAITLQSLSLSESVVTLMGPLGAGKTTFVRGFLAGMGYSGSVKSPTYTLVEPYELDAGLVYHFDLYRLQSPSEIESLGIRDYMHCAHCLIEWPQKATGYLPPEDIQIVIEYAKEDNARDALIQAISHRGEDVVSKWLVTHSASR
jgi:tRNA threonylcarbamoyladenosine biosynthesis protein TsaE